MKKIIFILDYPMATWEYQKYGIPAFSDRGMSCESWCSEAFVGLPKTPTEEPSAEVEKKLPIRIYNIASKADFQQKVAKLDRNSDYILSFSYSPYIYQILSNHNIYYGWFNLGSLPVHDPAQYTWREYLNVLWSPRRVLNFIKHSYDKYQYSQIKQGLSFLVCSGTISQSHFLKRANTHLIKAHNLDYNVFLESEPKNLIGKKYAVFLDVYAPFHSNFILINVPFPCTPENYYPHLERFFEEIERKMDLEVVIAAHPRSEYREKYPEIFKNRQLFKHRTAELVAHAELVITHDSASTNFAVIYKKKLLFVKDTIHYNAQWLSAINLFAKELGKEAIDLSKPYTDQLIHASEINELNYQKYTNKYIKEDGSPDRNAFDILADHLLSI